MNNELTWMIGGPQGSGVETAANIFSQVFSKMGYHVFGKREYYSNIKGEHSYFAVRISEKKIRSSINGTNILVAFDAETIFRHADDVLKDGVIIYDSAIEKSRIKDVFTLDNDFKQRLLEMLRSKNKQDSVKDMLDLASENGVKTHSVSFRDTLSEISTQLNNPRLKGMVRMSNTLGVSFSLGMLKAPTQIMHNAIELIFSKKKEVAELNKQVATFAYNYASAKFTDVDLLFEAREVEPNTMLVQGHYGTSLGKMVAGCRFQSYYPITPATDESDFLERNEILEINDIFNYPFDKISTIYDVERII